MYFYVYNLFLILHFCEKFVTWGLFSLFLCVYMFTTQVVHLREELNFLLMSFAFVKELITLPLTYFYSLFSYSFSMELEREREREFLGLCILLSLRS